MLTQFACWSFIGFARHANEQLSRPLLRETLGNREGCRSFEIHVVPDLKNEKYVRRQNEAQAIAAHITCTPESSHAVEAPKKIKSLYTP